MSDVTLREHDLRALGLDPERPEDQAAAVLAALGRPAGPDDVVVSLRCFCPTCEPVDAPPAQQPVDVLDR